MSGENHDEKSRIDSLLASSRITPEDHQILLTALNRRNDPLQKVWALAINPFEEISSITALGVGAVLIVLMSYLGAKFSIYFPGALDFQIAQEGKRIYSALDLTIQSAINVICLAGAFYVGALVARQRNLRAIVFFGTVAFARSPYAILILILSIFGPIFPSLLPRKVEGQASAGVIFLAILAIGFLVWQLVLIFFAVKESSGLKGKALWINFICGMIAAEAISYSLNTLLFK